MKVVHISAVVVPADRQRKEFDEEALSELCDSIALEGLFHAPVVRETAEGLVLVAGERRLRVIRELASAGVQIRYNNSTCPLDHFPIVTMGELSPEAAFEIELSENIKRVDLSWQERTAAEARLHELRSGQAAGAGKKQTYLATAEEIAGKKLTATEAPNAIMAVRQSVILSQHLADPEVAKAKTAKEAIKIVQKKEEVKHLEKLAAFLGTTQTADRHTLIKGDMRDELLKLPSGHFDCLLTDPPYGIDAQDFGSQVSNTHKFDDSLETWILLMQVLATESFRICKSSAHAYVFCDPRNFETLKKIMADAGWYIWQTPIIWNKGTGMLPRPEHGPRRTYEMILYAIKGDKKTTAIYPDVITIGPEKTTIHPDQKPVDLYWDLLRRSVRPGEVVLDPCAGSGTIFVASNRLQLTATGIEKEDTSFALSTQRLKEKV